MAVNPELPDKWARCLLRQGETGMDYQTASIALEDGRVIDDALIGGGTIAEVRGCDTIPFSVDEISDLTVTHRTWERVAAFVSRCVMGIPSARNRT